MSAEKDADDMAPKAIPKYSRYRSVRRAATAESEAQPTPEVQPKDDTIARSMSRYRKSRAAPNPGVSIGTPPVPSVPQLPRQNLSQSVNGSSRSIQPLHETQRRVTDPVSAPHRSQTGVVGRGQVPATEKEQRARVTAREAHIQEEEQRKAVEKGQIPPAQGVNVDEDEAARILADQKRKDLQRLEVELAAATSVQKAPSPKERLNFFTRKRGATKSTPPTTPALSSDTTAPNTLTKARPKIEVADIGPPQAIDPARILESQLVETRPEQATKIEPPRIEITNDAGQNAGGVAPRIDAPISASNAPDRRVLIRCKQSSINLPVNPETTPLNLIRSAANIMTQDISISHSILLESYTQLGLERRLRRYEHVRDVMNSWDRDTQNALIIQKSDSPQCDYDLDAAHVPKRAPMDLTVHMYHSQKPGKWNKRYITLLAMGQIFVSKKPDSKVSDKDVINICHLSDFDIYTPTAQQLRKVLRPPKKHCYAIKSQQKTTMFLSTENFVHFFSTDDEELAEKWYNTVQTWRSWYLVNRMGEGAGPSRTTKRIISDGSRGGQPGHAVRVSVDESPYTIGTFQPLINMERFGSPSTDQGTDSDDENRPRQVPFHLRNGVPMPSRESRRHPPIVNYKLPPEADQEFSSTGLLGRTYTQRQQVMKEKEKETIPEGPFIDGPSLLNNKTGSLKGLGHSRSVSIKSSKDKRPETAGSGLQRSGSQRQKQQKPLLDFTPTFKEPPQWDRSKHGHGVKPIDGLPLVEAATGIDEKYNPVGLPETSLLRRPTTSKKEAEGAFIKGGLVSM